MAQLAQTVGQDVRDVVLLVKANMRDTSVCQEPLLVMPRSFFERLGPQGPQTATPRNLLSKQQQQEFLKTAREVAKHPWNLTRASEYLTTWVENNVNKASQLLWDLDYVMNPLEVDTEVRAPVADFKVKGVVVATIQTGIPKKRKCQSQEQGQAGSGQAGPKAKAKTTTKAKAKAMATAKAKAKAKAGPKAKGKASGGAKARAVPAVELPSDVSEERLLDVEPGPLVDMLPAELPVEGPPAPLAEPLAGPLAEPGGAPAPGRPGQRKQIPLAPAGLSLGCSRCRFARAGCDKCRQRAGVMLVCGAGGHAAWQPWSRPVAQ